MQDELLRKQFDSGTEILTPQEVVGIRVDGPYRIVKVKDGTEISSHVLIIACGVSYRSLDGVKGIEKLTGAGVYYGASMVDALSSKGEDVFMIGGANSAGQAAIHFAKHAKTVKLLVRGDSLNKSMSRYLMHQINETPNIRVLLNSKVTEVHGENRLESGGTAPRRSTAPTAGSSSCCAASRSGASTCAASTSPATRARATR